MKTVYLACPYSHTDERIKDARAEDADIAAAVIASHRIRVYSPITHSHRMVRAVSGLLDDMGWEDFWREYDRWYVEHADELWVLMLPGWDRSVGVAEELQWARDAGKTVVYLDPEDIRGVCRGQVRQGLGKGEAGRDRDRARDGGNREELGVDRRGGYLPVLVRAGAGPERQGGGDSPEAGGGRGVGGG